MINNPFRQDDAIAEQRESNKRVLLAVVCAVAVTALLIAGYAYIRRSHAQRILAENPPPPVSDSGPKGPAQAHVVIDEPTLEKGFTVIGGVVKNISDRELSSVSVIVELKRRKDGGIEQEALPVNPAVLQPHQEGVYSMKAAAQDFGSIRLAGVKADPQSTQIVFTSAQGKKRAPERLEPRTVVVKRSGKPGEFINTPDNPGRLP
ncbi:MAG TPA: hypothetical protein VFZ22_15200 [Pyrinomonadaceae bacterium]|nr:hypothetical protein [Pyrinomonadaceae bacterium]